MMPPRMVIARIALKMACAPVPSSATMRYNSCQDTASEDVSEEDAGLSGLDKAVRIASATSHQHWDAHRSIVSKLQAIICLRGR